MDYLILNNLFSCYLYIILYPRYAGILNNRSMYLVKYQTWSNTKSTIVSRTIAIVRGGVNMCMTTPKPPAKNVAREFDRSMTEVGIAGRSGSISNTNLITKYIDCSKAKMIMCGYSYPRRIYRHNIEKYDSTEQIVAIGL